MAKNENNKNTAKNTKKENNTKEDILVKLVESGAVAIIKPNEIEPGDLAKLYETIAQSVSKEDTKDKQCNCTPTCCNPAENEDDTEQGICNDEESKPEEMTDTIQLEGLDLGAKLDAIIKLLTFLTDVVVDIGGETDNIGETLSEISDSVDCIDCGTSCCAESGCSSGRTAPITNTVSPIFNIENYGHQDKKKSWSRHKTKNVKKSKKGKKKNK